MTVFLHFFKSAHMATLLEKPVKVNRIVTTSVDHAHAIEDPARSKILEILYRKALSAEQITRQLGRSGHKRAVTTVRHHLDVLKESGLVEISRIDESRGAITKFYSTSTRLLTYETPKDFESHYSKVIENTAAKIEKILKNIIPAAEDKKNPKPTAYSHYLTVEIVNRAMTNVLEGGLTKPK